MIDVATLLLCHPEKFTPQPVVCCLRLNAHASSSLLKRVLQSESTHATSSKSELRVPFTLETERGTSPGSTQAVSPPPPRGERVAFLFFMVLCSRCIVSRADPEILFSSLFL